jgi:hypothetical protein
MMQNSIYRLRNRPSEQIDSNVKDKSVDEKRVDEIKGDLEKIQKSFIDHFKTFEMLKYNVRQID